MKTLLTSLSIVLIAIGCGQKKSTEIKIPFGEVGILVDSNKQVITKTLVKEGTYAFKENIYEVISFPIYAEASVSASFQTNDLKQYVGYITIDYVLDTTKVFEMYSQYHDGYYKMIFEPNLKKIFRETIHEYNSDSLRNEVFFNQYYNQLADQLNRHLSKEFFTITELKIDSIIELKQNSPFR